MWTLMGVLCRLLAPIVPHSADEAYRALWKKAQGAGEVCVHLESLKPLEFAADQDWAKALAARDRALKALEDAKARGIENPLDAEVILPDPDGALAKFKGDWPDMLGVSRVQLTRGAGEIVINDLRDEPRCDRSWKRDGTVKMRSDGGMLSDRDAEAVGVA
jgi:isoleucyl-tRNA synthetase